MLPGVAAPKNGPAFPDSNNLHAVCVRGALDVSRLRHAIDELQARHPRMQAKYYEKRGMNYLLKTDERIPLEVRDGRFVDMNMELERALAKPIDTLRGPLCHFTYVQHDEDGTGLVVFAQTHGVGDGRACEVVMSHLLRLYDGGDVPFYRNVRSYWQMVGGKACPKKLEAWHDIEEYMPRRDARSIVGTFVDPSHPAFEASFGGACVELLRLGPEETAALLQVSRRNGVTLTGTFAAVVHYAILAELVARGRVTEFVSLGMDMNMRGRSLGPEFDEECGNFVIDSHVHCPLSPELFETARLVGKVLKEVADTGCGFESNLCSEGSLFSFEALQLLRRANLDQWVALTASSEHANVSSLGVLKRFGKYKEFEVLENFSISHAMFLGCKVNCCTSGSSGSFAACVMVTRNVVPDARSLACKLRDHIQDMLRGVIANESTVEHQTVLQECSSAAEKMTLAVEMVKGRMISTPKSQEGLPFLGDTGRQLEPWTHLKVAISVVCSIIAAGCLSGFPIYQPQMQEAGVFSNHCEPGVRACAAQSEALARMYQNAQFLSFTLSVVVGCVFDRLGARWAAMLGAVCTAFSLSVVSLVVTLDAQVHPLTQTCLLYLCFMLSDACGLLSSFGVAGWLWHYPRHQALIIGLLNGSYQGSSIVGLLFVSLSSWGWSLSSGFTLVACANLLAAVGFYFATPSHEESLAEAARVLRMSRNTLDMKAVSGLRMLKLDLRALWGCLKIFPLENALFYAMGTVATVGLWTWLSAFTLTYQSWFGSLATLRLSTFFAMSFSPLGLILNPLAGLLMDRIRLPVYIMAMSAVMLAMAVLVTWQDETAQQWFILLIATYIGTMQNLQSKWSLVYAPPDLFGVCSTSFILAAGLGGVGVDFWTSPDTTALVLFAAFVLQVSCAGLLLRRGLPTRPPRNEFDSRKHLMSH